MVIEIICLRFYSTLDSQRKQETTMFVGSDDDVKVWLNGTLVHQALWRGGWLDNYRDSFSVTLKQGKKCAVSCCLVRVGGLWSGFFGFAPEYTIHCITAY